MANPQLENGYTPIANEILEALAKIRIAGEAVQVLFVIIRKTYGFGKREDDISLSQFRQATSLSKVAICKALKKLISMNIITKKGNVTKKGNDNSTSYCFQKDYSKWIALPKKVTLPKKVIRGVTLLVHTKEIIQQKKKEYIVVFEEVWKEYPLKDGRKEALKHFTASVQSEQDVLEIRQALRNYLYHLQVNSWKRPKSGSTWFHNWRDWVDWVEPVKIDQAQQVKGAVDYTQYRQ